ncbi:hypothetical protein HMPREF9628_01922 [Peptoanaerobacter stomatis]|uniref:IrrE N-terminal-like domain-containing protein n=1 Tax=Peptoanaerobacter stomatis TaxID=796937 RepID=G9XDP9_9FIRM|nr:ImmA/IrrE family metallo-endopeptidase [Peptoanaerobacter stomatis]EHL18925.1 hypothetical protein HMPREF9628_01922 [Peptoanaerobacter stomatis]
MTNEWIYEKANALVQKYFTRDPFELAQDLNIHLEEMNNTTHLLGMYQVIQKNRFIFLSADLHPNIRKVVLAHEIGHDQLHRSYAKTNAFHEVAIFRELGRHEIEANIFAAHLLIDDREIIRLLENEEASDCSLANELGVEINLVNLKISELYKMGILSSSRFNIERPRAEFLKDYNPLKDRDDSTY